MNGNDSVSLSQLVPGSNVVSSLGGGGAVDTLSDGGVVSGVVHHKLLFRTDDANATPTTGYGGESVATDITEDDLDDGSVIFGGGGAGGGLVRDKWGNIVRTCGIAGCQYRGRSSYIKTHKAAKHGIDVVWSIKTGATTRQRDITSSKYTKQMFMISTFNGTTVIKTAATTRQSKRARSINTKQMFMILTFNGTTAIKTAATIRQR
ncbi:hypothetical protein TrVE_jg8870 [Triparma verrucosa]|uniref:Uncharacterized protein n=1 Tax=Triparma verrucosa TaxID=1606542 RepID=A0A9W7C2I5_9STRA|nr:hypothetical protein TrVE_jg8870 [Triparma verrucosa]